MSNDAPAPPARRPHPRVPLAAAAGAALIVGIAGYALGYVQVRQTPKPAAASSCEEIKREATAAGQAASAKAAPPDLAKIRTFANIFIGNPSCFSAAEVAGAQTMIAQLDQGAAADAVSEAVCNASGNWPKC